MFIKYPKVHRLWKDETLWILDEWYIYIQEKIDDTNLSPKHIKYFKNKYEIQIKSFMHIDVDECISRDIDREKMVWSDVIINMWLVYQNNEKFINQMINEYRYTERYVPDETKPKAFIFDIDWTLATMNGRWPYDWHKVNTDTPNQDVISLCKNLHRCWHEIIILSWRDSVCLDKTKKWLELQNIPFVKLLLRDEYDNRKDSIIKKELFDKISKDYNIVWVFDDRDQVVKMRRDIWLRCYQVNYWDF